MFLKTKGVEGERLLEPSYDSAVESRHRKKKAAPQVW
jgi:hypothetical protein